MSLAPTGADPLQRVLVVEDEALVAEDLREMLTNIGYEVVLVARSGEAAMERVADLQLDLALLDLNLGGKITGIDVAARLRELDVPAVFVTAHSDDGTLAKIGASEAFGYVVKPFAEHEIRAAAAIALSRHRVERRLRSMERWLSTTLGSIGDAVIATDAGGKISFVNGNAEALTGWTRADATGRALFEVLDVRGRDGSGTMDELFARVKDAGVVLHSPPGMQLRTRAGATLPVEHNVAPIREEDGAISGVVVVFRDRTEERRLAEERRNLEQRVRETQRLESLGVLAGGVAHDFNNLLTVILGNASIAQLDAAPDSELAESLQQIILASKQAAGLCAQMLTYAGKSKATTAACDASTFVEEMAQLLRVSIKKTVSLGFDLSTSLPTVLVDPNQLRQLLMNLVLNASEALGDERGTITVSTREVTLDARDLTTLRFGDELSPGRYVTLEVADSGPGMPEDIAERIFDPFFTTKAQGRGLGLAAVQGIVKSNRAGLSLRTAPGEGTTLRIVLPPSTSALERRSSRPPGQARLQGTVIVADDEDPVRIFAATTLSRMGFVVVPASDGVAAVEAFEKAPETFTLALLDLTMPRMTGVEAAAAMRRARPDLPIVIMSGYHRDAVNDLVTPEGRAVFIQKPFAVGDLHETVRAILATPDPD